MRRDRNIIIYFLLFIPFIFLSFPKTFVLIKSVAFTVVMPLVRGIHYVTGQGASVIEHLTYPHWLVEENRKLNHRIDELETYVAHLEDVDDENQRLRDLLDFKKTIPSATVPARVIGRDANPWRSSLIVDKGEVNGLKPNMPVLTDYGLVGMLDDVGAHSSRVILLTDPAFKVSAMVQKGRMAGVVRGRGYGLAEMLYVEDVTDVRLQDIVVTSGFGGIFPKGLIIGGIEQISDDRNSLFKKIKIRPSVKLASLEEVLIVLKAQADSASEIRSDDNASGDL